MRGISYVVAHEANMKIHLLAAATAVLSGCWLQLSRIEWAVLSLTIFLVLTAEAINSAIEKTVDLVTKEQHPLARAAKDIAAGAVLMTAVNALLVAAFILLPKVLDLR